MSCSKTRPPLHTRLLTALAILWRTAFFYLGAVFWTGLVGYLFAVPPALVERLLGLRRSLFSHTVLHHGVVYCSLPWRLIADVRLDAEERAPEGQAVIISNHHSYIDIFLLFHIFPRIHMTARRTLFRIPFLGWAMSLLQHIPHRADRPELALERAAEWLRRGVFVGVFPEGTRAPSGQIGPFHSGAFRLAQRTTQKIQPVVVVGTGEVWAKNRFWVRRLGPVAMRVLPPIPVPAEAGRKQMKEIVEHTRATMLAAYRELERELFGGHPDELEAGCPPQRNS